MSLQLHPCAPSPEKTQLDAAHARWRSASAECHERIEKLPHVVAEERPREAAFLKRWSTELDDEAQRLRQWAHDIHTRQLRSGELVAQPDGSFTVAPPKTPVHVRAGAHVGRAAGATGRTFWGASFRSKVGLTGLVLCVLGCIGASAGVVGIEVLGAFGIALLIVWFFSGLVSGTGRVVRHAVNGGGAPGGNTSAAEMQVLAMRAQQQREDDLEATEANAKAAAEQRRAAAIARAQAKVADDDMEWG